MSWYFLQDFKISNFQVNGEPRKKHMTTKWEQLISKLTKCCQDMLRLASQRRRNFIVDQVRSKEG